MTDYRAYVASLPLIEALWWFIENCDGIDTTQRSELFFSLRLRYRQEVQHD